MTIVVTNILDIQDIMELTEAFRLNRTLHRDHYRAYLHEVLKPVIVQKWAAEATYHQRLLFKMCKYFFEMKYFDEDIWNLLIKDLAHK